MRRMIASPGSIAVPYLGYRHARPARTHIHGAIGPSCPRRSLFRLHTYKCKPPRHKNTKKKKKKKPQKNTKKNKKKTDNKNNKTNLSTDICPFICFVSVF